MKKMLTRLLAASLLLAGFTAAAVDFNFADGLKDWKTFYPDLGRIDASADGLKITVTAAGTMLPSAARYLKVEPNTDMVLVAETTADAADLGIIQVKLIKDQKEIKILNSRNNKTGKAKLEVRFNTGDNDTAAILLRAFAKAENINKSIVFSGVKLMTSKEEENIPRVLLAGDSTVCNYNENDPTAGWGQMLGKYLKDDVNVINLAIGGRSTKSFVTEKRWETLIGQVRKGDTVIIQFGHNDQKKNQPEIYAEAATDYQTNLKGFISEVKAKGGEVILCTPVERCIMNNEFKIQPSLGDYPAAAKKVGEETNTPVIDLNTYTRGLYEQYGKDAMTLFNGKKFDNGDPDRTHFGKKGADLVAAEFARQVKEKQLPLAKLMAQ